MDGALSGWIYGECISGRLITREIRFCCVECRAFGDYFFAAVCGAGDFTSTADCDAPPLLPPLPLPPLPAAAEAAGSGLIAACDMPCESGEEFVTF